MIARDQVLVLGGGPAGCAAAGLLNRLGHRVRLIAPASVPTSRLAESIPPSCRKLFDTLGLTAAIENAGFVRSTGNTVWWGGSDVRVEPFASGTYGWQVTRDALQRVLLDAASRAGVSIEEARWTADQIDAQTASSFVLDCTGRGGVVAKARGWRVHEPALRTVALVGVWRRESEWPLPDPSHTVIESYADGWAWSVPIASGERYLAVMVDPQSSQLSRNASGREVYLSQVAKATRFAALVADATLVAGPWGWDASMYHATTYAAGNVLLVGDAGSFIDPLSSAGVKKALASGWLAAIAVHTALRDSALQQTALDFFAAREREMYSRFREMTAEYLSHAAAGHANPFWTDRTGLVGEDRQFDHPARVGEEAAIRRAFDQMRRVPEFEVVRGPEVEVAAQPAVSGCEIVLERRVITPHDPAGVRYVHDVDVLALLELAPQFSQVPDVYEAYNRRLAPVALPDFLTALATALARGWLVWRDPPATRV